ncbi:hypothetical protein CFOL_v3_09857 [Cephalotus follicularis]|uniref:Uncharacterized protein n=1 Tax=Cephalotus follicularis TaxID=3775 RepID=A0A1Q3BE97_CEPFO|nr:hypothetical protein CFOL_v3_09857 [Cephalotus follicularis]
MACLNTYNKEQQGLYACSMDPRISFSNDFADATHAMKQEIKYREAAASSDFEFSVRNNTMIPADQVFFEGMLLPLKENRTNQLPKMTLRDELLVDDEFEDALPRQQRTSSGWWRERLGLKRANIVSKKGGTNDAVLDKVQQPV